VAFRIGLIGWSADTGLGYQNADLFCHLGVHRWLALIHPLANAIEPRGVGLIRRVRPPVTEADREWLLSDIDVLLFCEQPLDPHLIACCRARGIKTACWANHEWWPAHGYAVDAVIAPTRYTAEKLHTFGVSSTYVPMAVDTEYFTFRARHTAERFVFVHGYGGVHDRKNISAIHRAARLAHVPLLVYTLRPDRVAEYPMPEWVNVRSGIADRRQLYEKGDVCVQPSRFEGVGIPLLECQAAGMPLITTDAAPMSEYQPLVAVPGTAREVHVGSRFSTATDVHSEKLAEVLLDVHQRPLAVASFEARRFVEQHHSWAVVAPKLAAVLRG